MQLKNGIARLPLGLFYVLLSTLLPYVLTASDERVDGTPASRSGLSVIDGILVGHDTLSERLKDIGDAAGGAQAQDETPPHY